MSLVNERSKGDLSRVNPSTAHICGHSDGNGEPCPECKQFPGIVYRILTKEPADSDETTKDLDADVKSSHPRSLASIAREEDARIQSARTAWLAPEQAVTRRLAEPKKLNRKSYDKAGPQSTTTLHDWVSKTSRKDLLALLERNDHPTWFTQLLDSDKLRDYIINRRFKINNQRDVVPNGHKAEYDKRVKVRMAELVKTEKHIEVGTYFVR